MKDEDLMDFLVALASGEFDPEKLYEFGFPTLYNIKHSFKNNSRILEVEGKIHFPDDDIAVINIAVANKAYGAGKAYIPEYEASSLVDRIFTKKIDFEYLAEEFNQAIIAADSKVGDCPPLIKRLYGSGIDILAGISNYSSFAVFLFEEDGDKPIGITDLSYEKSDKEPSDALVPDNLVCPF